MPPELVPDIGQPLRARSRPMRRRARFLRVQKYQMESRVRPIIAAMPMPIRAAHWGARASLSFGGAGEVAPGLMEVVWEEGTGSSAGEG